MNLLITGRPGAGKGTQAVKIKDYFNIPHISTGDMFREAIANKTQTGLLAKSFMDKGELVPDSVTNQLVRERLSEADCKKGFLLDGYPRNLDQAVELDKILNDLAIKLDAVIDIDVPESILIERMCGRRICNNCKATYHIKFNPSKETGICDVCGSNLIHRNDDTEKTAKNRLTVYDNNTKPLLDYYLKKGILKIINGNQDVALVFNSILKSLNSEE